MLLFIYSHRGNKDSGFRISIQLLLLFIAVAGQDFNYSKKFQYNSCYCLSFYSYGEKSDSSKFQYNSCYCLSWCVTDGRRRFGISIQLLLLFIRMLPTWPPLIQNFNTTLVTVYETRNHGFMRSVRHCRQIYDKLPASYRVLQLLYPMLLRHARLPAGPIHYISSMSVILITVLSGSLFFSTISKQ